MVFYDDDKFYNRNQELIRGHLNRIAFGGTKISPATVLGLRGSYADIDEETKAGIYSTAYTGLMRFFLIYVLEWSEEEALLHLDEIFGEYGFKNVSDHGLISIPLMSPDNREVKIFRLEEREDIIRWIYNVNKPSELMNILESVLDRNIRKKTRDLLIYNIDRIRKDRLYK